MTNDTPASFDRRVKGHARLPDEPLTLDLVGAFGKALHNMRAISAVDMMTLEIKVLPGEFIVEANEVTPTTIMVLEKRSKPKNPPHSSS